MEATNVISKYLLDQEKQAERKKLLAWGGGRLTSGQARKSNLKPFPKELASPKPKICTICDVTVGSAHYKGKKHRAAVEVWRKNNPSNMTPWKKTKFVGQGNEAVSEKKNGVDGGPKKFGFCNVCEISLTSASHAKEHYAGKRHKENGLQLGREGLRAE